jgi:hypothetical protein
VEHGYWEQKGLTLALTDQGPYEFAVSGAGDEYMELANAYLLTNCPVDFNRATAAYLNFLPCTTSPAIFNPVFKASRARVFAPFFNKGMAALKRKTRRRQD